MVFKDANKDANKNAKNRGKNEAFGILDFRGKARKNEEKKRKMEIVNSRMPNSRMPTHFSRIAQKIGVNRPSRR